MSFKQGIDRLVSFSEVSLASMWRFQGGEEEKQVEHKVNITHSSTLLQKLENLYRAGFLPITHSVLL